MSDNTNDTPERKGPADTIRSGLVKATMWERSGESGPAYATTISRTYTDKDGQPRDTPYLSGADLLRAARVAEKAHDREQELVRERAQQPERDQDSERQGGEDREDRRAAHRNNRQRGTRRPHGRDRE